MGGFSSGMHAAAVVSLLCLSVVGQSCRGAANCRHRLEMAVDAPGGKHAVSHPSDVARLQELAKYAVDQINRRAGSHLKLVRLVSTQRQVVAGVMYYLILEVVASSDGSGARRTAFYEARVWVKAWENFKSLEGFREIERPDLDSNL